MISAKTCVALIVSVCALAVSARAQAPAAASDAPAADRDSVTAYSIKSGRLMLSSLANPGPVTVPDGAYTDDTNTTIAFLGGRITRVQTSDGAITEISNVRLSRARSITLTPNTNALMAVGDVPVPSGKFISEDGKSSITIRLGRPTAFRIPEEPAKEDSR